MDSSIPDPAASSPDSARDAALGRAARALLSDVAAIDQVAAPVRRPLLAAQIRQFGLDEWAARERRRDPGRDLADPGDRTDPADPLEDVMATLVQQLESALAGADDGALLDLQRHVLEREVEWPKGARDVGPRRPPRLARHDASALAETFVELPDEDRVALARLLELKESWARGDLAPGVALARRGEPVAEHGPLAAAFRTTLLFTTIEAGEDALADAIAQQVDQTLKEFLRDLEWIDLGGGNGFSIGIKVKSGTLPQGKPKPPKKQPAKEPSKAPTKDPAKKSSDQPAKQRSTEQ